MPHSKPPLHRAPSAPSWSFFAKLPGVGARSAERIAFHILKAPREEVFSSQLSDAIRNVKDEVQTLSPSASTLPKPTPATSAPTPTATTPLICVVEQPKDLLQLESTGIYKGTYHVLLGRIAPPSKTSPRAT